jgi:uncharacterized protein (TIGR03086 family)
MIAGMDETIADRFRRRALAFTETVSRVPDDRWDAASPCDGWSARDLVQHVADTQGLFAGFVGRELDAGPDPAIDPLGTWVTARDQTQAALDDPILAGASYEGFTGPSTFEQGVDRFLSFDLVVHRWDLARAAGLPADIPPADLDAMQVAVDVMTEQFADAMRGPGAFGPELTPPEGADTQTRLLAFLGRQAW